MGKEPRCAQHQHNHCTGMCQIALATGTLVLPAMRSSGLMLIMTFHRSAAPAPLRHRHPEQIGYIANDHHEIAAREHERSRTGGGGPSASSNGNAEVAANPLPFRAIATRVPVPPGDAGTSVYTPIGMMMRVPQREVPGLHSARMARQQPQTVHRHGGPHWVSDSTPDYRQHARGRAHLLHAGSASAAARTDSATVPPAAKVDDELHDDSELCVICLTNVKTHAFVPCGHRCVCQECGDAMFRRPPVLCPVCRGPTQCVLQIFT